MTITMGSNQDNMLAISSCIKIEMFCHVSANSGTLHLHALEVHWLAFMQATLGALLIYINAVMVSIRSQAIPE